MATAKTPEPMTADAASRVAEFARACKAAIRIVSMYPPSHPTIQAALARMVAAGTAATQTGPLVLTVSPESLLVAGRGMPRPEAAVDELAVLLHAHQVGELTVKGPLTAGAWHMLLSLLATSPEEVRQEGGLARAWQAVGGGPVDIREIDYAEVLRERDDAVSTVDPAWDELIGRCLVGDDRGTLDERALASLLEIARDAERLGELLARLQARARGAGHSAEAQQAAVIRLLRSLAEYTASHSPDEFDEVMNNIASGTTRLGPDLMLSLLAGPAPPGAAEDARVGIDLGGEIRSRFTDERLAAFVAENVARHRGATNRLAAAFNALVTSDEQRDTALLLAEERVSLSPLGADPQFNDIWTHAVKMLLSYSDADFVPAEYDRELNTARALAVEIEHITDDPPDRIAAWLSTVRDDDLRALDQQMLVDLLRLEDRPDAWGSVLELALSRLEQLVLVGDLRLAGEIAAAIAGVAADPASPFAAEARDGLGRASAGPLVGHLMLCMRQMSDGDLPLLHAVCHTVGAGLVGPLVGAIGTEESRLAVRRAKDVLVGFGAAAREPVRALRDSPNPAVRRLAIEVMQAVGGEEALGDLRSLLADADSHVQREALRAIVRIGSHEAFGVLEESLKHGDAGAREAIMQTIGSFNDERAAPLLVYILEHTDYRGAGEAAYRSAIEALGRSGATPRGIAALKDALYRGEWWAPLRTARLRDAAARALHATGSSAGDAVLEEAASRAPRQVRRAAARALSLPRRPRPAGGTP
jgi:HEAT repeat protein